MAVSGATESPTGISDAWTFVTAHTRNLLAWAGGLAAARLIGAAARLVPALRAARLPPTEALWSLLRGRQADAGTAINLDLVLEETRNAAESSVGVSPSS